MKNKRDKIERKCPKCQATMGVTTTITGQPTGYACFKCEYSEPFLKMIENLENRVSALENKEEKVDDNH